MLVAKHKRGKDGPAICPMLPDQYKFMDIYIRRIRPYFAKPDEDALFVTTDGIAFREGTIDKRLSAFIEKCGVDLGGCMAFVDMCKMITTQMLDRCSEEERAILQCVLAHTEKTSRQWYARPDFTNTAIKAMNIIQWLLDVNEKAKFEAAASTSEQKRPPLSTSSSEEEGAAVLPEKQRPPASPLPSKSKVASRSQQCNTVTERNGFTRNLRIGLVWVRLLSLRLPLTAVMHVLRVLLALSYQN